MPHTFDPDALSPDEALQRLVDGNKRFLDSDAKSMAQPFSNRMASQSQRPFAVILGCSDSRIPVEIVFDQGFGDLFVVRVAGNIAEPSVIGSIEFAVSQFGTRLVVVMGHTRCGAVTATVKAMQSGQSPESDHIRTITDRISPHIEEIVRGSKGDIIQEAVRANVLETKNHLHTGSEILRDLVNAGRVSIVGAEYQLETGAVQLLNES